MKYVRIGLTLLLNFSICYVIVLSTESISDENNSNFLVQSTKNTSVRANDTYSISGSILSTIDIKYDSKVSIDNLQDVEFGEERNQDTNQIEGNSSIIESQILESSDNFLSSNETKQQSPFPTMSNQTDNLSNNLVSMLSGIIIQSIEKGNPTINSVNLSDPLQMERENVSIIIAGNWEMAVLDANVTGLDVRFVMITSNGVGFHWHSLSNFRSNNDAHFGEDQNIYLEGTVDFLTDSRSVLRDVKIIMTINNLETLQIVILDDRISEHLYGYPLFGTIDMIEIPN